MSEVMENIMFISAALHVISERCRELTEAY